MPCAIHFSFYQKIQSGMETYWQHIHTQTHMVNVRTATRVLWALHKGIASTLGIFSRELGVVFTHEVKPRPHQIMALSMGQMFCFFFPYCTPRCAGAVGIKWIAQSHNSKAQVRFEPPTLGLGVKDLNNCTKLLPHTHTHTHNTSIIIYYTNTHTQVGCAWLMQLDYYNVVNKRYTCLSKFNSDKCMMCMYLMLFLHACSYALIFCAYCGVYNRYFSHVYHSYLISAKQQSV